MVKEIRQTHSTITRPHERIQSEETGGPKIRLFADDCVCYREIKEKEDTVKLQNGIDRLGAWTRFQPIKCNMM